MLEELTMGELLGWGSAAVVALSGVVEFSKIKINPWTWLARHVGRAINGEVLDKMDTLNDRVDKLSDKVGKSDARQDERDAKTARTHILRFGDEVRIGTRHFITTIKFIPDSDLSVFVSLVEAPLVAVAFTIDFKVVDRITRT